MKNALNVLVFISTLGIAQEIATEIPDSKHPIALSEQTSEVSDDKGFISSTQEVASTIGEGAIKVVVGATGIVALTGLTIITLPLRLFKD